MATLIRPELSRKNKYWISKNRYYELKYFCLQYPEWLEKLKEGGISDHEHNVLRLKKVLLENQCKKAGGVFRDYIFKAVTTGVSYDKLNEDNKLTKDDFYDIYRKFFWLLSNERD